MSLFSKVFVGSQDPTEGPVSEHETQATAEADTPFASYVKDMIRFGAVQESTETLEDEIEAWEAASDEDFLAHEDTYDDDEEWEEPEQDYSYEETEEWEDPEPEDQVVEEKQEIVHQPSAPPTLPNGDPSVFHASSTEQKDDTQVQRIVDGLFDRMRVVWGPQQQKQQVEEKRRPRRKQIQERKEPETGYALMETKKELTQMIRREVPQAMKTELATVVRTEIMKVVRGEIVRVVRDEFESLTKVFDKVLDRLHAMEARLAQIEGSVGKELKLNFPKGMVKIDAPVTVPEREVKVAAPINVQPPSVTFDEGAISVQFNKTGGSKKEVRFERDPHSDCVKSAEIIDVPAGN